MQIHSCITTWEVKKLLPYLMCVNILWGCSSTELIHPTPSHDGISYSEFNDELRSSQLTVELMDRRSFLAREIHIASDSTSFLDVGTDVKLMIPTAHIKQITMEDRAAGRSRGLLAGALAGGIGGMAIAISTGISVSDYPWSAAILGGIVGGGVFIGGLVGGAIGSGAGHTRNFMIAGDSLHVK
jgi:hypothetical protein